ISKYPKKTNLDKPHCQKSVASYCCVNGMCQLALGMKNILHSKKTILIISLIFILCGSLTIAKLFLDSSEIKNYNLDLVKSAEAILSNEVKKGTQLVIVNFWASWCPPCIHETPSMLNYAKNHSDKIQLFLVSEDSSSKEIRDFVKAFSDIYSVNLRIIWDANRKIGQNFKVYKMPETFIFDNKGKLLRQLSGSVDWSQPELHKLIAEHLKN
ncbi:MAG TPA: TlpA disulfide reductase family protein, partial [Pseudobdellovibrionaceae bacterium]